MSKRLDWARDGIDWPHRAASRFVSAAGLTWHVQRLGRGPSLILIHGTAASTHSWAGLVDVLEPYFELTLFDLPGHAFTEPVATSDMSLPGLAEKVAELLRVLETRPAAIVGHSAGAGVAARMVIDGLIAPPSVIVSLNGALLNFSGLSSWLLPPLAKLMSVGSFAAQMMARRAGHEGAVDRVLAGTGAPTTPQSLACYHRLFRNARHVKSALDMMAMWDLQGLERDLPKLQVPIALVACGEDLAVPAECSIRVRDLVPRGSLHYVRGLGHLAHEENAGRIGNIVRNAFDEAVGLHAASSAERAPALQPRLAPNENGVR